jgi:hypothetical protein
MTDQLAFTSLLAEADERANRVRDLHRGRVQEWFDALPYDAKATLGHFMTEAEWDTCCALSVAACDHHRSQRHGVTQ